MKPSRKQGNRESKEIIYFGDPMEKLGGYHSQVLTEAKGHDFILQYQSAVVWGCREGIAS